ncbi:MAG TPA: glycosyltransferase family A protein [Deinococcales bacterium]|nr:glycosyltransferase family A protein [Deinococcales bacterium]
MTPAEPISNDAPLVTVVVPAFNSASFLEETLLALRRQTLKNIVIHVIDDGSTDNSASIVERHAAVDPRVRLTRQPNRGVSATRNRGIQEAESPLVALCDADDVSVPERLERQVKFLSSNPDVAIVSSYGWRMGATGRVVSVYDLGPTTREEFEALKADGEPVYLILSSVMVRRDVAVCVGGFRSFAGMAEDLDFFNRVADEHVILTLPERLIRYRVHGGSASNRRFNRQTEDALLIRENMRRRRAGQRELTAEEFHEVLKRDPWVTRAGRALNWRSRYAYRVAGGLLANGRLSGWVWLAYSFVLCPSVPTSRLRAQVLPRLRGQ